VNHWEHWLDRASGKTDYSTLLPPDGPRAALVALDNRSGEVRAMVGGDDYGETPFNLATQGQRQPGSAM
jgi:penicillin-binding protein 1A